MSRLEKLTLTANWAWSTEDVEAFTDIDKSEPTEWSNMKELAFVFCTMGLGYSAYRHDWSREGLPFLEGKAARAFVSLLEQLPMVPTLYIEPSHMFHRGRGNDVSTALEKGRVCLQQNTDSPWIRSIIVVEENTVVADDLDDVDRY